MENLSHEKQALKDFVFLLRGQDEEHQVVREQEEKVAKLQKQNLCLFHFLDRFNFISFSTATCLPEGNVAKP